MDGIQNDGVKEVVRYRQQFEEQQKDLKDTLVKHSACVVVVGIDRKIDAVVKLEVKVTGEAEERERFMCKQSKQIVTVMDMKEKASSSPDEGNQNNNGGGSKKKGNKKNKGGGSKKKGNKKNKGGGSKKTTNDCTYRGNPHVCSDYKNNNQERFYNELIVVIAPKQCDKLNLPNATCPTGTFNTQQTCTDIDYILNC
ncbi:unnamed protein product [Mytilus coruscus]|uniref:Uncharacterized protein n=1 Tax=Mytilus coruscus TaxID=42192 RepID=A0A6J8E1X5_MYTCO|nr:unnamed protein product [Mytilus coruscus]